MALLSRAGLRFLYRQENGVIDRRVWLMGVALLAAPLAVMTLIWFALMPWAMRGLDERALLDARTLAAYVYLLFYACAVMLGAVCYTMLSMKRLRERALPTGLAGLPPLAALLAGAAHWLQPRVADVMPRAFVIAADVLLVAILLWTAIELGARGARRPTAP